MPASAGMTCGLASGIRDLHGGNASGLQEQAIHGIMEQRWRSLSLERRYLVIPGERSATRDPCGVNLIAIGWLPVMH